MINIRQKDFVWNYIGYGLNIGLNIILLPVVLRYLNAQELGLWYVFVSVGSLVILLDLGFSAQFSRLFNYSYSGASTIEGTGIPALDNKGANLLQMLRIFKSAQLLYFLISSLCLIFLLIFGTLYILHISKAFNGSNILIAWVIYVLSCFINIHFQYYTPFLRGIGKFVELNRAVVISKSFQLLIVIFLLYLGLGILGIAVGFLCAAVLQRFLLKFSVKKIFKTSDHKISLSERFSILKKIWHNSSREGLVLISKFLNNQANTLLCSYYISLSETGTYALCVQILTMISSISLIYFTTVQPKLLTAFLQHDLKEKQLLISESFVVFIVVFLLLVIVYLFMGVGLLEYLHSQTIPSNNLFLWLSIYYFLDTNQSLCASYLSCSNVLIYVKSFFISSVVATILSAIIVAKTDLSVWGLVFVPILVQASYNNWKWPIEVLRDVHLSIKDIVILGITGIRKRF